MFRVQHRGGAATTDGADYENHMFLLILLNLLEDEDVEDFDLARNVEGLGIFDDIVIKVKYYSAARPKLILVQLKYSARTITSIDFANVNRRNGNFQLAKYFESYKAICSKIGKFEDGVLNDCSLEDVRLVLYTRAQCSMGAKINRSSSFRSRKLLETGNEESDVFEIHSPDKFKRLHSEMKDNNNPIIEEGENGLNFLQKLVIFSAQRDIMGLKNILKNKLRDYVAADNVSGEVALQMALNFINENNSQWLSRHSGVLSRVQLSHHGMTLTLREAEQLWTKSIARKILVKHICSDMENGIVRFHGNEEIERSDNYYIDRYLSSSGNDSISEDEWRNEISEASPVLISGVAGMGKSSFFTRQAKLIKSQNPEKYVIRKNLLDYLDYFSRMDEEGDADTAARMFLEEISGVSRDTLEYEIFDCSLHSNNMMAIFLDGVDEISPDYYSKLLVVIQSILQKFQVQLFLSTRPVVAQRMEDDLQVVNWQLQEFQIGDSALYFQNYCNVDIQEFELLRDYAVRHLLGLPIFCGLVRDIINNSSGQDAADVFKNMSNKSQIYDKFVDVMFEVHHRDKLNIDVNNLGAQRLLEHHKKVVLEQYETLALLAIFDEDELQILKPNIKMESNEFLKQISEGKERTGFITNVRDGRPTFLHRTVAEYFCGSWMARNINKYTELLTNNKRLPVEVDYFMSNKLPNQHELFTTILNVHELKETEDALVKFRSQLNIVDPLNRSVLDYVNRFQNPWAIRYLLFNGLVTDEMVRNCKSGFRGPIGRELAAFWLNNILLKYEEFGNSATHLISLLMHDFYNETKFLLLRNSEHSPLHTAILKGDERDIAALLNSEDINSRNVLGLTPLHLAVYVQDKDLVETLAARRAEYRNDNVFGVYPHQLLAHDCYKYDILDTLELNYLPFINKEDNSAVKVLVKDYASQGLFLHDAVQKTDLERVEHLISNEGCDVNQTDAKGRTALHVARAGITQTDKFLVMALRGIKYVQDSDGLYPHDYEQEAGDRCSLGYAFACGLELLPEEDTKIFNYKIVDLLGQHRNLSCQFEDGIRLRQSALEFSGTVVEDEKLKGATLWPPVVHAIKRHVSFYKTKIVTFLKSKIMDLSN